jgi:hypothetical protein
VGCVAAPPPPAWGVLLPPQARRLPVELATIDAYLDDEWFIAPWRALFSRRLGRPSVPVPTIDTLPDAIAFFERADPSIVPPVDQWNGGVFPLPDLECRRRSGDRRTGNRRSLGKALRRGASSPGSDPRSTTRPGPTRAPHPVDRLGRAWHRPRCRARPDPPAQRSGRAEWCTSRD